MALTMMFFRVSFFSFAELLDLTDPNDADQLPKLLAEVNAHWKTDDVRKALQRVQSSHDNVSFLRSNEWIQHWIDASDRVLAPDFVPTDEDMLKLRRSTSGAQVLRFTMRGQPFELIDLGGQTHEMKSWAYHMEQDIAGVIFLLSLATSTTATCTATGRPRGARSAPRRSRAA